jgi:chromosome segregation ATPase
LQETRAELQKVRNESAAHQSAQLHLHAAELEAARKQRDAEAAELRQQVEHFRESAAEAQGRMCKAEGLTQALQAELDECKRSREGLRVEVCA